MASKAPRTLPLQALGLVALGLGLLLVGVLALEGMLALLDLGTEERHTDAWVGFAPGADLFERREVDGAPRWVTSPAKLGFFNEQSFAVDPPPDLLRIFALGGSTTAGRPYDAAVAFPAWLERWIGLADPNRPVEVVNAGAVSYASYRVALLERELLRFDPDVFLLYSGHNEFLEERTYGDLRNRPEALRRLEVWLGGFRSWALLRSRLGKPPEEVLPAEVTARLDDPRGLDSYRRDPDLAHAIVAHYEENLRRIVELARDADVEVLAVRPASNLRDFSPFKSTPSERLSSADRQRLEDLLAVARRQLDVGDNEAAAAHLAEIEALDRDLPDLHYLRGQVALAAGDVDAARRAFVAARDLDVAPLRATSTMLAAYDRVVADLGVDSIDLPSILEERLRAGGNPPIPGNESFLDHVHPRLEIHALLAEEMLDRLAQRGLVEIGAGWSDVVRDRVLADVRSGLDPRYIAQRDLNLSKVLGWAGKLDEAAAPLERAAQILVDEPEVHLNLGVLALRAGRLAEARQALERARALAPDLAPVPFNLGVVLGRLGDAEAGAAELRRAVALAPESVPAWINLAHLERERGDLVASRRAVERALTLAPDDGDARRAEARLLLAEGRTDEGLAQLARLGGDDPQAVMDQAAGLAEAGRTAEAEAVLEDVLDTRLDAEVAYRLGVLRAARGDREGAAEAYARALEIDPSHRASLTNRGIHLASTGRAEEAVDLLRRAAELDPADAGAWLNLGVALDQAGRSAEAVGALERAVAADPEATRARLALVTLLEGLGRGEDARAHRAVLDRADGVDGVDRDR